MGSLTNKKNWRLLNEIFAAAIELQPDEQIAFLNTHCAADLRPELEAMLAASRVIDEQGFLEGDAFDAASRMLDYSEELIGKRIGAYQIVREVGRGGMGAVYLAQRDDKQFLQEVALKIIKRGMDSDEVVRRFRRERQVLAALNHSCIARLFDGGTTAEGLPFFVMEYVEGIPITRFCEETKLDLEQRLRLFQKVCDAVSYIHEQLIVHRDIKPSNILVTKDGCPKLLDFGVAKLLMPSRFASTLDFTATGVQPFTPHYASPEQVRGASVTKASDIFALGVLLYELVSGQHPLALENCSPLEILKVITEQDPTPPSQKSPPELQKRLRGDLDNITLKALRKEPEQRYQSVAELSEDIRRHLEQLPIMARPASVRYRLAKFTRRHQIAVTFAMLLLVFVIAVGTIWTYFYSRPTFPETFQAVTGRGTHSIAVLPFVVSGNGNREQSLAADLTATLIARLGRIQELKIKYVSTFAPLADKELAATGRQLNVDAVLRCSVEYADQGIKMSGRLIETNSVQEIWSGSFTGDLVQISRAQDALAERVAGALLGPLTIEQRKKVQKRYTDNAEAYRLYLEGRFSLNQYTEQGLKQSIQLFNRATRIDPGYALAYSGTADAYHWLSSMYVAPNDASPKAKAAALKALELDPELPEAYISLALILSMYEWNWAEAEPAFKKAIEINPNYATAHHWYGRYLALNKRRSQAIAELNSAREIDPLSALIMTDNAWSYFFSGDYDRSIEIFNKAIELDNEFMVAYWVRGWARQSKGDLVGAKTDYEKALSLEDSPTNQAFLANAYVGLGKRAEGLNILNNLLEMRKQRYISGASIAAIYAALGDKEQALGWVETAFKEHDEWLVWIKYDPRFDELKKDRRFQSLLQRVGLPV